MSEDLLHQTGLHIRQAFADTPYPGDERVAAYARYGRSIADALRGKHWSDITLDTLYQHRWELFLLTPETFRFYLPVFLLAALYHYAELDTLPHNVVFCLTPQREEHVSNYFSGQYRDYFSRRAAAFNRAEKGAILAFLETYVQLYGHEPLIYDIDLRNAAVPFWQRAHGTD